MAIVTDDLPFTINLVGDDTGEKWFGEFRALRRLSYRAQMTRDRLRREFLGEFPQYASPRIMEMAIIFADLAVSITKAPNWWVEANNGQDLADDNLLREVWRHVMKIQGQVIEEEKAETQKASKKLKKAVESGEAASKESDDE